jgi:putative hydrolase of HD superfamily
MEQEELLSEEQTKAVIDLGNLILQFGKVDRATYFPDGVTPESDTDHTVMLGIIACAFADAFAPELDRGKIAQFALVHDLAEVYAGDTHTLGIQTEQQKKEKEEREYEALERIKREFDSVFPWIGKTIESYESLDTSEARFVKFVDKVLPKITHLLSSGVRLRQSGIGKEDMERHHKHQYESISATYGADQAEVRRLYATLSVAVREALYG